MRSNKSKAVHAAVLFTAVTVAAVFFAMVEIQIEGSAGWAGNLPTWRIESGPLINIFWGGRPLTGYHVWVFSFMALVFHLGPVMFGKWSLKLEARILGSLMLFWIIEDFTWFAANPAFGARKLFHGEIPWHKHMLAGLPHDYWIFAFLGLALLWWSFRTSGWDRNGS